MDKATWIMILFIVVVLLAIMIVTLQPERFQTQTKAFADYINQYAQYGYYQNDNTFYNTGGFFYQEGSPKYQKYNEYKKDPERQPNQAPTVQYEIPFESTLNPSNPMHVILSNNDTQYINLLNPVQSINRDDYLPSNK